MAWQGSLLSCFLSCAAGLTECEKYNTDRTSEVLLHVYGFWFIFFSIFFGSFSSALSSSSDVAVNVYLTSEFVGFALCLHPLGIHLPKAYRLFKTTFKKGNTNFPRHVIVQALPTNIT